MGATWTRDRWRGVTCEILLKRYRKKSFLHRIVTRDEKWTFFENPKRKKPSVDPGAPFTSTARPNRFGRKTMLCVWWDQKGVVYYELLKPKRLISNAINNNWSIWTVRCLKNDQNTKRGNTRSFFSMTMLHHIRQNQFGTRWKHSAGKFYPMRLTHQTWLFPITTCLHRWVAHSAALWFVRRCEKMARWMVRGKKRGRFFYWRGIHKLLERWEKCVTSKGAYFE